MMNQLKRSKRRLRNFISIYPSLYCPLAKLSPTGYRVVGVDTDLVIEGYPRSGNSYVEAAFKLSQPDGLRIAHHTHAAANVLRAHQLGKPCYVVVRNPRDAAVSLVIQEPNTQSLPLALMEYERFHRAIEPIADRICLVPFEIATQDFNASVVNLNACYGTDFEMLDNGITRADIMKQIDATSRRRKTVPFGVEPYSPEATKEVRQARQDQKKRLLAEMDQPDCVRLLTRCLKIYDDIRGCIRCSVPASSGSDLG